MASIWTGFPSSPASTCQTLEQQITIWKDSVEVLQAFPHVEPGSAVIIDEAQTVFRSMQKVEPGLLRWLETHRHYGVDILLMSQDFRQMSQGVTRLVEATVKFRKLAFVGLSKKYQGKVRGNPEDHEVIRAFVGTYSPAIYAYYSSYASAAIREEKRSHTVFKSARVAIGIAAGLFAIGLMVWRPWSSLSSTKPIPAGSTATPTVASEDQPFPTQAVCSAHWDCLRHPPRLRLRPSDPCESSAARE
jgi:zona occludens toxin